MRKKRNNNLSINIRIAIVITSIMILFIVVSMAFFINFNFVSIVQNNTKSGTTLDAYRFIEDVYDFNGEITFVIECEDAILDKEKCKEVSNLDGVIGFLWFDEIEKYAKLLENYNYILEKIDKNFIDLGNMDSLKAFFKREYDNKTYYICLALTSFSAFSDKVTSTIEDINNIFCGYEIDFCGFSALINQINTNGLASLLHSNEIIEELNNQLFIFVPFSINAKSVCNDISKQDNIKSTLCIGDLFSDTFIEVFEAFLDSGLVCSDIEVLFPKKNNIRYNIIIINYDYKNMSLSDTINMYNSIKNSVEYYTKNSYYIGVSGVLGDINEYCYNNQKVLSVIAVTSLLYLFFIVFCLVSLYSTIVKTCCKQCKTVRKDIKSYPK